MSINVIALRILVPFIFLLLLTITSTGQTLPVGSVVPVFLSPEEIKALAPVWLPADGRIVDDPRSPFHKKKLPDLVDRTILGTTATVDVIPENEKTKSGSLKVSLTGKTANNFSVDGAERDSTSNSVSYIEEIQGPLAIKGSKHVHRLPSLPVSVEGNVPLQPFRRLVYLILVRKS